MRGFTVYWTNNRFPTTALSSTYTFSDLSAMDSALIIWISCKCDRFIGVFSHGMFFLLQPVQAFLRHVCRFSVVACRDAHQMLSFQIGDQRKTSITPGIVPNRPQMKHSSL